VAHQSSLDHVRNTKGGKIEFYLSVTPIQPQRLFPSNSPLNCTRYRSLGLRLTQLQSTYPVTVSLPAFYSIYFLETAGFAANVIASVNYNEF
jgi:hypothetical protein